MYLKMQCQSCTGNTPLFESLDVDGIGFCNERNIVNSDGFYYDMKSTVKPYFIHHMGIKGK